MLAALENSVQALGTSGAVNIEQNAVTALRMADTGVVLNLGRIVQTGPASEIASDEKLRHAYLGY